MDGIKIEVTGSVARVIERPSRITSGTVGLPVEFTFDSEWDGLRKVAVFHAGEIRKDMVIVDGATVVPIEIMEKPNVRLHIGVYGVNEDGSVAITTIWANVGKIYPGAVPGGDIGSDVGTAKQQYEDAVTAAEKAEFAADRAEAAADRAEAGGGGGSPYAVLYTAQTLTDEQKAQARENIGALSAADKPEPSDAVVQKVIGDNLVDPDASEKGVLISKSNGTVEANASYNTTDYIPIKAGQSIDLCVVGTRKNVFGPLHQLPAIAGSCGPANFVTGGASWTDEYVLIDSGAAQISFKVLSKQD